MTDKNCTCNVPVILNEFYSDNKKSNRRAILKRDKYHFIIEMYDDAKLVKTELVANKSKYFAEDVAENWVEGLINL